MHVNGADGGDGALKRGVAAAPERAHARRYAALDFSRVPRASWIGRVLRLPLRLVPAGTVVPVLQGPCRGCKWVVGSATHGCWLGSYELSKVRLSARLVAPGDVVYDIGANAGYYTLLFSRLVGARGSVVAFEPLPRNVLTLHRHLVLNHVRNATVVPVALADLEGQARFLQGGDPAMGRLAEEEGAITVPVLRVDDWRARGGHAPPALLKIDTEGAEARVLEGARVTIESARPVILCSTHGAEAHDACMRWLAARDYRLETVAGAADELLARPREHKFPATAGGTMRA